MKEKSLTKNKNNGKIKDNGNRIQFESGAVRYSVER